MATTSLHMTTMCLQYKPTLVACVCIHLACKWSSWRIEPCSEGKEWYYYVDKSVTLELLETLTQEFIAILETSPHRFKRKFMAQKDGNYHGSKSVMDETFGNSKHHSLNSESRIGIAKKDTSPGPSTSLSFNLCSEEEKPQVRTENPKSPHARKEKPEPTHSISLESYREKREKERLEQKVDAPSKPTAERVHKVLPDVKHTKVIHPTSNKVNHVLPKGSSENKLSFGTKSSVNSDPVVLLERVTVKTEPRDVPPMPEVTVPRPLVEGTVVYHKHQEGIHPIRAEALHSSKPKHQKYKANSLHNSHERSPAKTNGSKEGTRARPENSEASRHERRERHKSKHSGRSSKEKPLNNHTSAEPIKVKIRKDIIRLPEAAAEPPKPGIKIKLKPPVPEPTPLKLVFKKDKSGSGSYSASQRQNESRKRSHSPSVRDSVKRPHHDSSKSNRHRSNHVDMLDDGAIPMDMYGYKQFYPYQITPPPPPPPIPPPLIAPPLPPQPPPPPPQ